MLIQITFFSLHPTPSPVYILSTLSAYYKLYCRMLSGAVDIAYTFLTKVQRNKESFLFRFNLAANAKKMVRSMIYNLTLRH